MNQLNGQADADLLHTIDEQIDLVDRRVGAAHDLYAAERQEIRRAASQVQSLRAALGLGRFLGTVGPQSGKPQLRFLFESGSGREVVLKVYGRRRRGEAEVQHSWRRGGVRVVEVLAFGDDPISWLLMPRLQLAPLCDGDLTGRRQVDLTTELATVVTLAHRVDVAEPIRGSSTGFQLLTDALIFHLGVVLTALRRAGYAVRTDWREKTRLLTTSHNATLLHGDLAAGNVVRDATDQGLRLLDTCGYIGPREFDAARWAARLGGPGRADLLLQTWLAVESDLDRELAHRLLGLELLMEAGVREIVRQEKGIGPSVGDERTTDLLTCADHLLDASATR